MLTPRMFRLPALILSIGLLAALLAGCGGGGGGTTDPSITLVNPIENPALPGSIGGTVFTMAAASATDPTGVIDQAFNAEVTIRSLTGPYNATTRSTVRGGYTFPSVPAGEYRLEASVTSPTNPDLTLTGEIDRVRVRGNIPTLMVNVLLGNDDTDTEVSGYVTLNGAKVAGANVTLYIIAHNLQYLEGDNTTYVPVVVTDVTGADGGYRFRVPTGGAEYNIAAHAATSRLQNQVLTTPVAGVAQTVNLVLSPAITPIFLEWAMDVVSVTLPAATTKASEQALITRLTAARRLGAPSRLRDHLDKLRTQHRTTRATGSFIENDLYWYPLSAEGAPYEYSGFHVYRGATATGLYTFMGSNPDPDGIYFYDNDPALNSAAAHYYTVVSYAANGAISQPFTPVTAAPLPQITVTGPADGASVKAGTAVITWEAVPGAKSYLVTKFAMEPTFNAISTGTMTVHPAGSTSETLSGLAAGNTYWYSVSAYNTEEPNYTTAASFSPFRTITLTP